MRFLDFFSGIGGFRLGMEMAGHECLGHCEIDKFADKSYRAMHNVKESEWYAANIRNVEPGDLPEADCWCGGFPCQPFSVAGNQKGKDDDRYLWPEMLRVIHECKPTWVIGENVPGIINMALEQVCTDLENEGYEVQPFIIPAAGVGAPHRRKRVFILGHSKHNGLSPFPELRSNEKAGNERWEKEQKEAGKLERTDRSVDVSSIHGCENGKQHDTYPESQQSSAGFERKISDEEQGKFRGMGGETDILSYTTGIGQQRPGEFIKPIDSKKDRHRETSKSFDVCVNNQWETEPDVGRVANGIPNVVDRIKCLGNAVVPQQAYPIFQAIADIESRWV